MNVAASNYNSKRMAARGETLVAIMNDLLDWQIAREQLWYRIPVPNVRKLIKDRWPPKWLAFYQTKVFGSEAYAVNYYARVRKISEVPRYQLFPDQPRDAKGQQHYYKIEFEPLKHVARPVRSLRLRRIVFIPTTLTKLLAAEEINDLFDDSPLEDQLWHEFKRLHVTAERQEIVKVKKSTYMLDFAIYCTKGKVDVETDGDTWHADKERIPLDNQRSNDLEASGWHTLRFNSHHVNEELTSYCLPTIVETINRLGGLNEGRVAPRFVNLEGDEGTQQLPLF